VHLESLANRISSLSATDSQSSATLVTSSSQLSSSTAKQPNSPLRARSPNKAIASPWLPRRDSHAARQGIVSEPLAKPQSTAQKNQKLRCSDQEAHEQVRDWLTSLGLQKYVPSFQYESDYLES